MYANEFYTYTCSLFPIYLYMCGCGCVLNCMQTFEHPWWGWSLNFVYIFTTFSASDLNRDCEYRYSKPVG